VHFNSPSVKKTPTKKCLGRLIKSPLKEAKLINNNNTELSSSEKRGERKDGRVSRSLSPRKSVSPDKTRYNKVL